MLRDLHSNSMAPRRRVGRVVLKSLAVWLSISLAMPFAAVASDAKCAKSFLKNTDKVGAAWRKNILACVTTADKRGESTAEACAATDSKGKAAKATTRLMAQAVGGEKDKCEGTAPSVGYSDPSDAAARAEAAALDYAHALFGEPLDLKGAGGDKELATCRKLLWKGASKLQDAMYSEIRICVAGAIKDGTTSPQGLVEACFAGPGVPDPKGKIAGKTDKLLAKLTKKNCADGSAALRLSRGGPERATAIEYGLIAALIAVVIIGALTALGTALQNTFDNVATPMWPANLFRPDFADDGAINGSHLLGVHSDIVVAEFSSDSRVCLNNENGTGFSCTALGDGPQFANAVTIGPFATQAHQDAIFGTDVSERLCVDQFNGSFSCGPLGDGMTDNDVGLAALGIGGVDGAFDVVLARPNGAYVCSSNGLSGYTGCAIIPGETFDSQAVAVAGFAGDIAPDLIFANSNQPNRVCVEVASAGTYSFSCSNVNAQAEDSRDVAVADLNGDQNVDAVFATSGEPNRICLNDGQAVFTCGDVSPDTNATTGVAVADVDLDGDVDLIFANDFSANRLCVNNGVGFFSCADLSPDADLYTAVNVGDVNGDGYPDAVFTTEYAPNRVCTNTAGVFSCADLEVSAGASKDLALAVLP